MVCGADHRTRASFAGFRCRCVTCFLGCAGPCHEREALDVALTLLTSCFPTPLQLLPRRKRRTFQSNARIFRGRIVRRLRAAWRSLRWTFTLYRPSDIQRSLAEDTALQFRCKALTAWILLLLANSLIVAMIFTGYLVMHDSTRRVTLIMLAAAAFSCLSMVASSAMGMCHQMKLIRVVDADEEGGEGCHQDRVS